MKNETITTTIKVMAGFALAVILSACGHEPTPYADARPIVYHSGPAERVLANRGDLSIFYQALVNTGVANELSPNARYSIFAPTNAAFAELQPKNYPCFYSVQCRTQLAAILRNHIVQNNDSLQNLSKGSVRPLLSIAGRAIYLEEAYKNDFTVDKHSLLYQNKNSRINLYIINGLIANENELAPFRVVPVAETVGEITETMVFTFHAPIAYPTESGIYAVPGGYTLNAGAPTPVGNGSSMQTTTVIQTTTTQQGDNE